MAVRTRVESILVNGHLLASSSVTELSRHEHDCDTCVFMGRFEKYDLYFCPSDKSLIARYGVYGEYMSSSIGNYISLENCGFNEKDSPLSECLSRVRYMGLY